VEICIEAVNISGEEKNWCRVKLAFRLLGTGEDTVLKDLLARIDRLSELELQQSVADILAKVSVVAEKVDSLEKRGRRHDDLDAEAAMQKNVAKVLCVDDKEQYWETTYRSCRRRRAPDTGQWLLDHGRFREWYKVDDKERPSILVLEAPDSHGKTFLSSTAINRLWQLYVSNTETKLIHVAYFFFGNSEKDGRTNSEEDAIASLIWQLIQTDLAFLKFVAGLCRSGQLSRNSSMWADVFDQYASRSTDASTMTAATPTHFLVLDGVNHIKSNISKSLRTLIQAVARQQDKALRIKLLVTGDEGTSKQLGLRKTQFSNIEVSKYIESDLRIFVRYKLKERNWPLDKPGWRQRIEENLVTQTQNFGHVSSVLDRLITTTGRTTLETILEEGTTVDSCILALSKSPAILKDLNALIPWIVLPERWPNINEVKVIISLSRGEDFMPVNDSFADHLRKTYPSPLLNVVDDRVESFETMHFFEDTINQTGLKDPCTAPEEASDTVGQFHPAEVKVIENILLQACGKDLYKRFEFEEFFRAKRSLPQKAITFNPVDGHLKIIVACVQSLQDDSGIDTRALRAYAIENLPRHIHEVILSGLAVDHPTGTAEAIKHLHFLFTKESYMKVWLSPKESDDTLNTWLRDDAIMHDILGLSQNKAVQSTNIVPNATKTWLDQLKSNPTSLYNETAEFMAKQWLRQDTWEVMSAFRWVRECCTNVSVFPLLKSRHL
jgi:hypothetical protein